MLAFIIFAITFLSVLLIAIIWMYPSSKKVSTIPGLDPSSKEDGNLSDISKAGSLHEFLLNLHAQYGEISGFWMGQNYIVSVASPQIFKATCNIFDKPKNLLALFDPVWGSASIECVNSSEARSRRQTYDKAFTQENIKEYYNIFQERAELVAKKWSGHGESDHISLSEDAWSFAIHSSLRSLLGTDFKDDKLVQSVNNAFCKAWFEIERRVSDSVVPDMKSSRHKALEEAVEYLRSTIAKVITRRREAKVNKQLLIDVMIDSKLNEDTLVSDVITCLVRGLQTTANLVIWAMYFLAAHPEVQIKVQKEISRVLGEKDVVNPSNYSQLKYLRQVLEETLRCAVVVPWTSRVQEFDTELGGHKVPKNTPVVQALGVVLQDSQLFPLPHRFDPDRFNKEKTNIPPFAFSPFGFAGKRMCPAHDYTYLESTVFLVNLIRKFEVKLCSDMIVKPVFGLVTHPQDEVWVSVVKRK